MGREERGGTSGEKAKRESTWCCPFLKFSVVFTICHKTHSVQMSRQTIFSQRVFFSLFFGVLPVFTNFESIPSQSQIPT